MEINKNICGQEREIDKFEWGRKRNLWNYLWIELNILA